VEELIWLRWTEEQGPFPSKEKKKKKKKKKKEDERSGELQQTLKEEAQPMGWRVEGNTGAAGLPVFPRVSGLYTV